MLVIWSYMISRCEHLCKNHYLSVSIHVLKSFCIASRGLPYYSFNVLHTSIYTKHQLICPFHIAFFKRTWAATICWCSFVSWHFEQTQFVDVHVLIDTFSIHKILIFFDNIQISFHVVWLSMISASFTLSELVDLYLNLDTLLRHLQKYFL